MKIEFQFFRKLVRMSDVNWGTVLLGAIGIMGVSTIFSNATYPNPQLRCVNHCKEMTEFQSTGDKMTNFTECIKQCKELSGSQQNIKK